MIFSPSGKSWQENDPRAGLGGGLRHSSQQGVRQQVVRSRAGGHAYLGGRCGVTGDPRPGGQGQGGLLLLVTCQVEGGPRLKTSPLETQQVGCLSSEPGHTDQPERGGGLLAGQLELGGGAEAGDPADDDRPAEDSCKVPETLMKKMKMSSRRVQREREIYIYILNITPNHLCIFIYIYIYEKYI